MENLVTYVPILKRCTAASLARMRAREPHAQLQGPKTAPCFALEKKQSELEVLHKSSRWLGARETDRREGLRGLDDRDCGRSEAVAV